MEKTHITEMNHIIIREIILPGAVNESFLLPATLFTLPVPLKFKDNDKIVAADAAKTFIQVLFFFGRKFNHISNTKKCGIIKVMSLFGSLNSGTNINKHKTPSVRSSQTTYRIVFKNIHLICLRTESVVFYSKPTLHYVTTKAVVGFFA